MIVACRTGTGSDRPVLAVPRTTAAPSATCPVSEATELIARMATLQMKVSQEACAAHLIGGCGMDYKIVMAE
jgi:hypothetical protein